MKIKLEMKNIYNFRKVLLLLVLSFLLPSCSAYHSSFSCPDAKGGKCLSIDKIDYLITSGEIEKVTETDTRCRGLKCKSKAIKSSTSDVPVVTDEGLDKVFFTDDSEKLR